MNSNQVNDELPDDEQSKKLFEGNWLTWGIWRRFGGSCDCEACEGSANTESTT